MENKVIYPDLESKYEAMNNTELEYEYFDMFGHTVTAAPRESIITSLLDKKILADYMDPVHVMRNQISNLVSEYWENIQMQLKCGGTCYKCNKGTVVDCWLVNREHLEKGEVKMSKADVNKMMSIEEMEESGFLEDRNAMIRYISARIKENGGGTKDLMRLIQAKEDVLAVEARKWASDSPDVGDEKESESSKDEDEESSKEEEKGEQEEKKEEEKEKPKKRSRGRPRGAKNKKSKAKGKAKSKAKSKDEDQSEDKGSPSSDVAELQEKVDNLSEVVEKLSSNLTEALADVKSQTEKNYKALEAIAGTFNVVHDSLATIMEYSFFHQVGPDLFEALAEADDSFPFAEEGDED